MPRLHYRRFFAALLTVAAVAVAVPTQTATAANGWTRLGVSSPHEPGTTVEQRVTSLEATFNQGQFGALRLYHAWDEWFPQGAEQFLTSPGRDTTPVLSVDTVRVNGDRVWWRAIAEAQPGSKLHNEMVRWADDVRNYAKPIVISLNHEPDYYRNGGSGSPIYYRLAYQKFTWILRNRGANNAETAFIGVAWNFDSRSTTQADDYYPGDNWVDVLGVDGYNWGHCRLWNGPWRALEDTFEAFLGWAESHPNKPLMIAEFGAAEDYTNFGWRKRDWIRDATAELERPRWNRLKYALWWDNTHEVDTGCNFHIKSSIPSRNAFAEMLQSPRFN